MEGEVGAGVAPPVFLQQPFLKASNFAKKRNLPWQNPNPSPHPNWNPRQFDWDSVSFTVKPSSGEVGCSKGAILSKDCEDDCENLSLRLGGGGAVAGGPSKKARSASPGRTGGGSGNRSGSYPMCQVDDCGANLSNAKDYHRRHKVCEIHSKMTKALVGTNIQRFCQQCSRFHLLSEFDEGRRSCRRRLAGHNRRRRKTQPEDSPSHLLPTGNQLNNSNGNMDVVKLLGILSRLQGTSTDIGTSSRPDGENVVKILNKVHSVSTTANNASRMPASGGFDLNVSQVPLQASSEQSPKANGNPLTTNQLAVFSATLATPVYDALADVSQISSDSCADDKGKVTSTEHIGDSTTHSHSTISVGAAPNNCPHRSHLELSKFPARDSATHSRSTISVGTAPDNSTRCSHLELSENPVREAPSLSLQLFSDDRLTKPDSMKKYVSSESSDPMEERPPSYSSPAAKKFFPLHSVAESMSVCDDDRNRVKASTSQGWTAPLDLFKGPERQIRSGGIENLLHHAEYTSSSGSDHVPYTSNSDVQDRTERITFKLFDKDPSKFPKTLRMQILKWLSNSPSEMESYIRPGCVVLSVYASMPLKAWNELENNFLQRVSSLVQFSESEFWQSGRFLVCTNKQLASHEEGKVRLCKSWRTWSAPELTLVTPVAVISGNETTLVLRGRNLTVPGTKIHCTFNGGYISKEVLVPAGTLYDASGVENFSFSGGSPNVFGRCFVEVENSFKGSSFPVIIADATICQELRDLEKEFGEEARSTTELLHFLNELGWLFQRKKMPSNPIVIDFSTSRFRCLLIFSVERDWVAVVRTLLDMLVQQALNGDDNLQRESMEMLLEIQLLNRAVKRKCKKMADMLLHYSVKNSIDDSKTYLFPPNSAGPAGMTPLHLAASTQDSEDMIDALTNDPQEIGLRCWSSIEDDNGQSPHMYASARNNHSYNTMVARKLADRNNCQISVVITTNQELPTVHPPDPRRPCARCDFMENRRFKPMFRTRGLLQRPYVHSMLAIAAVCVCVCVFLRGAPHMDSMAPFIWEKLEYGPQ